MAASAARRDRVRPRRAVAATGLIAIVASMLYFLSDVIEVTQGRFSDLQLWITLIAEAAIPVFVIGLWLAQRPQVSRLGFVSAIAYAYAFVYFTGTVVYALVNGTHDFRSLQEALDPAMTAHGAVMVAAGIGFGSAVYRAKVLPAWTGIALGLGVILIPLSSGLPAVLGLIAVALRDAAFVGMGAELVRGHRTHG